MTAARSRRLPVPKRTRPAAEKQAISQPTQAIASPSPPAAPAENAAVRVRNPNGRPRTIDWNRPLSVSAVSRILRVAENTVRNFVKRGILRPLLGTSSTKFSREEVLRVAARYGIEVKTVPTDGEIAALAFVAFRDGKTVRDVVIDHKMHPDQAEELLQRYVSIGGDQVLPGEVVKQIQALGFFHNRALDPRELPQILQFLLSYCEQVDPEAREARAAWQKPPAPSAS